MKIENSEINKLEANTSFNLKQSQETTFLKQLYESKTDIKEEIKKQNLVRTEVLKLEKVLLSNEKDLNHNDRINKTILETILNNFTNEKDIKLEPKDNSSNSKLYKVEVENYTYIKHFEQKSSIDFKTQAQIKTNRGQINIDLNLSFSQEFSKTFKSSYTSQKVTYIDPLIINYKSELNSFDNINSSLKFEFDLNSDGKNELIPTLKEGSGFLALDKNNNNKIDNGKELFGTITGDGFSELSAYDDDKNSWIDENDSIFDKLLIWKKNEKEESELITLGQAGIGAIYLSAADSSFSYYKDVNEQYAKLKQTSFYLNEEGKAGLVTSVDFAI